MSYFNSRRNFFKKIILVPFIFIFFNSKEKKIISKKIDQETWILDQNDF